MKNIAEKVTNISYISDVIGNRKIMLGIPVEELPESMIFN
jgi:hypothetical protein